VNNKKQRIEYLAEWFIGRAKRLQTWEPLLRHIELHEEASLLKAEIKKRWKTKLTG
jgi:hypothetical protein